VAGRAAEFPHLRRESDRLKAFVSRRSDRFRRAYEPVSQDWPRSCSFWPTVNELTFSDFTGNRRYLPAPMSARADLKAIVANRDQLWAEAVHLYNQGTHWWLKSEVELTAAELQGDHLESSAWDELVSEWLAKPDSAPPFTTRQVLEGLGFGFDPGERTRATKADEMLIAGCLKRLGYRNAQSRVNGSRVTGGLLCRSVTAWHRRTKPEGLTEIHPRSYPCRRASRSSCLFKIHFWSGHGSGSGRACP
jgi:Virulence-associated protein E